MTTDRTIALTPDQARRVLVGIGTTDDGLRVLALNVMAVALTAADEPAIVAEPAPAPMSSARAELHALAPLPWTADGGDVEDADGHRQFEVLGQNTHANDARLAGLVARIVNEPEPAPPPASVALRALAVDEVLAAARDYAARLHSGLFQILTPAEQLCRAVRALDALGGKNS